MKTIIIALVIAPIFIISVRGQGFLNLNFESAQNLPGDPEINGTLVPVTNALPDWAAYNGPNVLSEISYVSNSLGGTGSVVLVGGNRALSGDYSIELYTAGSISQTGLVPDNAQSLQFEAEGPGNGGSFGGLTFVVTLGGQTLSYWALSDGPDYIEYEANIPADMEGQTESLSFAIEGLSPGVLLDNIEFSSMSVPEPSASAFLGLGAILVGMRRCRKPL